MKIYDDPMKSDVGAQLFAMYDRGRKNGWNSFIGGSASRWLKPTELSGFQNVLEWDGTYRPIKGIPVPRLSRECFIFIQQEGVKFDTKEDMVEANFSVIQVGDGGETYRVLWRNLDNGQPPLEVNIHLAIHNARVNGPGGVAYHIQPANLIALAALAGQKGIPLEEELIVSFAALYNLVPDGVDVIPWGMPAVIKRGMPMTIQMEEDMRAFLQNIAEHCAVHEAVVLDGEGLLCASDSEQSVHGIVRMLEAASEIRLKLLAAGGR